MVNRGSLDDVATKGALHAASHDKQDAPCGACHACTQIKGENARTAAACCVIIQHEQHKSRTSPQVLAAVSWATRTRPGQDLPCSDVQVHALPSHCHFAAGSSQRAPPSASCLQRAARGACCKRQRAPLNNQSNPSCGTTPPSAAQVITVLAADMK